MSCARNRISNTKWRRSSANRFVQRPQAGKPLLTGDEPIRVGVAIAQQIAAASAQRAAAARLALKRFPLSSLEQLCKKCFFVKPISYLYFLFILSYTLFELRSSCLNFHSAANSASDTSLRPSGVSKLLFRIRSYVLIFFCN